MRVADILSKSRNEEKLSRDDLIYLLGLSPDSPEIYRVLAEANCISKELTDNRAEIHAQLALNLAPCPCNCMFCSFARVNGVFDKETRLEPAQAMAYARQFEADGANAINPAYSGAARRISIPGTRIAAKGMISELRMAQIVAVTRLGMPRSVPGNCTHEPCALGAVAGANLFWAEAGANPRDVQKKTEDGRGETVSDCKNIFAESGWDVWEGPSRYYNQKEWKTELAFD